MAVELLESQSERVRHLMQAGGFADETAVVSAALDLLERKQRLHAMIQEGIDAADQGEVIDMDDAMRSLRVRLAELRAPQAAETSV